MKKLLLFILIATIATSAFTQIKKRNSWSHSLYSGKLSNDDFFNQAEFIFEAKQIAYKDYYNSDSTEFFRTCLLEISEIYKGSNKLNYGTVQYITKHINGVRYEDGHIYYYAENVLSTTIGKHVIFFCNSTKNIDNHLKLMKANNNFLLQSLEDKEWAGLYNADTTENNFALYGLKNLYFKTREDFYQYLTKYPNTTAPTKANRRKLDDDEGYLREEQKIKLNDFMNLQNQHYSIVKKNNMRPENVNPNNFAVEKIIYNDTEFSIAFGQWESGTRSIGMRWNGVDDNDAGYPKVFGNPMWFLIPEYLAKIFVKSLLDFENADNKAVIEILTSLYND